MTLREDVDATIKLIHQCSQHDNVYVTNKLLKLVIEQIDIKLRNVESEQSEYYRGYLDALRELKQDLEK